MREGRGGRTIQTFLDIVFPTPVGGGGSGSLMSFPTFIDFSSRVGQKVGFLKTSLAFFCFIGFFAFYCFFLF